MGKMIKNDSEAFFFKDKLVREEPFWGVTFKQIWINEGFMWVTEGNAFYTEGTTSAKTLKCEHEHGSTQRIATRPVWLLYSERGRK